MSRIIKSGGAVGLSSLHSLNAVLPRPALAATSVRDEELQAMLSRIAKLEADLRQRETQVADLRIDIERARDDGRQQGYEAGLEAAEDRQSERLALLKDAMVRAHAMLSDSMRSVMRLAPLLAQECVDLILGEAADRAEFIARIAEKQLDQLDRSMLVGIQLSHLDFPDDAALTALAGRLGLGSLLLAVDSDVPPGGCIMVMQLGRMSVGLDQQWPALRDLLHEMSLPETAQ